MCGPNMSSEFDEIVNDAMKATDLWDADEPVQLGQWLWGAYNLLGGRTGYPLPSRWEDFLKMFGIDLRIAESLLNLAGLIGPSRVVPDYPLSRMSEFFETVKRSAARRDKKVQPPLAKTLEVGDLLVLRLDRIVAVDGDQNGDQLLLRVDRIDGQFVHSKNLLHGRNVGRNCRATSRKQHKDVVARMAVGDQEFVDSVISYAERHGYHRAKNFCTASIRDGLVKVRPIKIVG